MDAYHLPSEAVPPPGLMFLLGTRALISLMPQQALDWQIHLLVMDGRPFYANKWSSPCTQPKTTQLAILIKIRVKLWREAFSLYFLKKLRTTSQDGSQMMWTSWNSFKQRLMFLKFLLSFNWISKGYKTAVSLSSSLIRFVVGYTLLLSFDVWIFQFFLYQKIQLPIQFLLTWKPLNGHHASMGYLHKLEGVSAFIWC